MVEKMVVLLDDLKVELKAKMSAALTAY